MSLVRIRQGFVPLIIVFVVVLAGVGLFVASRITNIGDLSPFKTSALGGRANWWPMQIGNWWRFKQIIDGRANPCNSNRKDRTAWIVQPANLATRDQFSRTLAMYKTDPCMYNFVGGNYNIDWSIRYPVSFASTDWLTQMGVQRFVAGDSITQGDTRFNLPFSDPQINAFRKDSTSLYKGELRVKDINTERDSQFPYTLLPYDSLQTHTVKVESFFDACNGSLSWSDYKHVNFSTCEQRANGADGSTKKKWYNKMTVFEMDVSQIPALVAKGITRANVQKVEHVEVFVNDVANQTDDQVFCDHFYHVENIGPVQVDSTGFRNDYYSQFAGNYPDNIKLACSSVNFSCQTGNQPCQTGVNGLTSMVLDDYSVSGANADNYSFDSPTLPACFFLT